MCVSYVAVAEAMAATVAAALTKPDPEAALLAAADEGLLAAGETEQRTYPRRVAPVIIQESEPGEAAAAGAFDVITPSWGFEAPGHTDLVFNTRIESALGNVRLWREAVENGRAVVCAHAFFENHATQTVTDAKGRQRKMPYRFALPDGPLLMAALVGDGRYSVMTQPAVGAVKPIHSRMPLLLDVNAAAAWLAADCPWRDIVADQKGRFAESLLPSAEFPETTEAAVQLTIF